MNIFNNDKKQALNRYTELKEPTIAEVNNHIELYNKDGWKLVAFSLRNITYLFFWEKI